MIKFDSFSNLFFNQLETSGIKYSVLRNYKGLPNYKDGSDIDILLPKESVDNVLKIISLIDENIVITSITRRNFITALYLYGIDCHSCCGLKLDLVHSLSLKGVPYLDSDKVLRRSEKNDSGIRIPHPVDEAFVSCHSSFLLSGVIKERYFPFILNVFRENKGEVLDVAHKQFGKLWGNKFFDYIISRDTKSLNEQASTFIKKFKKEQMKNNCLGYIRGTINHLSKELPLRSNRAGSIRVAFLGPDGAGKSTIIDNVTQSLVGTANDITVTYLKPTVFLKGRLVDRGVVTNPHDVTPRGWLTSLLKLCFWAVEYRIAWLFRVRNFTIEVYDRYYHDLYIDKKRYLYSGPDFFIKIIEFFIPKPDIFIVLVADSSIIQKRKSEVSPEECERQVNAYKEFSRSRNNAHLVQTECSPEAVSLQVQKLIVNFLINKNRM